MYNGVQMKAADPMALLMGSAGQTPPAGPEAAAGFDNLLNLVPSAPSMNSLGVQPGQGAPETIMDIIKNGWSGDMIPLLAPQELIALSGQGLPTALDTASYAGQPPEMNGTVLVGAEILPPDDINDDMLYLNVRSLGDSAQLPGFSNGDNEAQEMILPMRLRTVELRGGQIIADAGMQTATGKEIPIRLKLDIAGSTLSSDAANSTEQTGNKARSHAPLPRLLQELDVRMIVIEQVALDEAPTLRPGQPSTRGIGEQSPGVVDRLPGGAISGQSPISPLQATDDPGLSSQNSDRQRELSTLFQQMNGTDAGGPSAAEPELSPMQAITAAQMAEAGTSKPASDPPSDVDQVRFYDLDHKLNQLRQNPGQRIKIQLMPPRLGRMELSVVSHRGLVTVNLTVESTQAKQAVEHNLPQLEQRLAVSGIKVDTFQLHVNQADRWNAFAQGQHQYYHGGHGSHRGRDFRQTPYNRRGDGTHLSDAGFQQELVNCLA